MPITTEAEAVARLDQLREERVKARLTEQHLLDEIKAVLRQAAQLRDADGQPINRSVLIDHSGLSRRTAYQILGEITSPPADKDTDPQ